MPLATSILAIVPWKKLADNAPRMVDVALDVYERVRSQRRPRLSSKTVKPDDLPQLLRADVSELQERVDSLEGNSEAQAELIAQMAQHEHAFLRWLIVLTLVLGVTSAVAIVALAVAFSR